MIRTKMTATRGLALAFFVRWLCGFPDAALAQQEIVTLATRPRVTQSYFLTSIPKDLQAVAVLFSRFRGLINLRSENGQPKFGQGNFSCVAGPSSSSAVSPRRSSMHRRISKAGGE